MRRLKLAAAAALVAMGVAPASAGGLFGAPYGGPYREHVCWNPPDAVEPGFAPCGPYTGLNAPRRVDGVYGNHPDEWYFNLPISPPGVHTGSSDVGTPPGWDQ